MIHPRVIGLNSRAMSSRVACLLLRNFKSWVVDHIAFGAGLLTAGVNPQNRFCERGSVTERGLKQYPSEWEATVSNLPLRRSSLQ